MSFSHLLIPHALVDDAVAAPAARAALQATFKDAAPSRARGRWLPWLQDQLGEAPPRTRRLDAQGAVSAHEVILAQAQGLDPQAPPWAALRAHTLRLPDAGTTAWAFLTPAHWVLPQGVGQTQVRLSDPSQLQLDEAEARAFCVAMQPYFAEDGLTLHLDRPGQWLVCGEALRGLRSPAPGRVLALGGDVAPWLPSSSPGAPLLRRLQNEMQMLLYTHAANDAREARGLPSVNSFWLHGCGALATAPEPQAPWIVLDSLSGPALHGHAHGDWRAWAEAWRELDAQLAARMAVRMDKQEGAPTDPAQTPTRLVLCGLDTLVTSERSAPAAGAWWHRLRQRVRRGVQNQALAELLVPA
ncbi:phosphoglycerate mutase [Hylemonella gracilis]|jgi:hypothetical protein|uniref:Phosphoglycerate mutase n=1 Tax=Hylemonella gracilis TaxID=80880 RepID=A0A4P6UHK6_9BURK|nr:phosphoglycerate mutase [Hylemonella gracilis]QBK04778.1 phosphoglycerate mutase [Hylemonella gracilis]